MRWSRRQDWPWARTRQKRREPIQSRHRQLVSPALEVLEQRTMLATVAWLNSSDGDWDTPGNWDANRVPVATDDAVIPFAGITVTHSANVTDSIASLTSQAGITLSGGTLNIAGHAHVDGPV